MSKIKTGEVVHHTTGDICGNHGSILGSDYIPTGSGTVRVTPAQAVVAKAYGWEVVSEDDGIILIYRSPKKAELCSRKKRTPNEPCSADSVVSREPRQLLAQAYQDNGDYGSAATIRAGQDPTSDTQIALLAIKGALAATPTPPTLSEDLREESIAAFGAVMFGHIWESFTDDRWDIEINDLVTVDAVKAGLVSVAPYDPEIHNDQSGAAEVGDDFYEITPAGRAALALAQVKAS